MTRAVDLPDEELIALRLGGGPYLLLECPFTETSAGFGFLIEALLDRDHLLLLAHPERCPAFQRDPRLLHQLVERGVLCQVTAGALTGTFGRTARDVAHRLVREGRAHVIASDAHDPERRRPSVLAEVEQEGYAEQAAWYVEEMPRAILAGRPLPPRPALAAPARTGLRRLRRR